MHYILISEMLPAINDESSKKVASQYPQDYKNI